MDPSIAVTPLRSPRLSEQVIRQIDQLVRDGSLMMNARFPSERELEQRWQVSRPVLREAFRVLEMQGVVESRPGGGRYLRSLRIPDTSRTRQLRLQASRAHLLQLWEAREALESKAAALAAERASAEQIEAIGRPLRLIETLTPEALARVDLNREFHLVIAQASGNVVIENQLTELLRLSDEVGFRTLIGLDDWADLQPAHQPIYLAIKARDPKAARRAMVAHFNGLRRSLPTSGITST